MAVETFVKPFRVLSWPDAASADWALVQQCAGGDEAACARLVTDHQRMVYQLALHLLGDPQEAADLSQEVFLRVFRTLPQFRGQSTLKTWIYRIVVNQASNRQRWWRRRHRSQQVPLDEHTSTHGELAESRNFAMPDRVLQQRETADRVWEALDALPFEQRAVVVLREIDGLSYEEIATSLGIAVGTVKSRLARARDGLRARLRPAETPAAAPAKPLGRVS
jgi:RNA polymerase sigma-70 factor, ECF subfamily